MPRDSLTQAFLFSCTVSEQITPDVKPDNLIRFTGDRFCFITGNLCVAPVIKRNRVTIVNLLVLQSKYLDSKESINIAKKLKAACTACNEIDIES
jgi:hypothetical protein